MAGINLSIDLHPPRTSPKTKIEAFKCRNKRCSNVISMLLETTLKTCITSLMTDGGMKSAVEGQVQVWGWNSVIRLCWICETRSGLTISDEGVLNGYRKSMM